MGYKILVADDDEALVKMLRSFFELKKYTVVTASDGMETLEKLAGHPDIILLDINMPKIDGMEICRRIRDKISCPILFLTARADEQDRINGLLSGGDDYIVKPFSLKELDARITAHLRREARHREPSSTLFQGDLSIDYLAKRVQVSGHDIDLTKMEYDIIEFLSMNPGLVYDKERIYEKVQGYDREGDSRVVSELVRRIRKKLQAYTDTEYIETVWGMGYRWIKKGTN
jgi:DNA-binding response OmpR family regulator